jgi:hypothetical protein
MVAAKRAVIAPTVATTPSATGAMSYRKLMRPIM